MLAPGEEGAPFGPQTFLVSRDRSIWLADGINGRLLVWRSGAPDRIERTVPLPLYQAESDFALGPREQGPDVRADLAPRPGRLAPRRALGSAVEPRQAVAPWEERREAVCSWTRRLLGRRLLRPGRRRRVLDEGRSRVRGPGQGRMPPAQAAHAGSLTTGFG